MRLLLSIGINANDHNKLQVAMVLNAGAFLAHARNLSLSKATESRLVISISVLSVGSVLPALR